AFYASINFAMHFAKFFFNGVGESATTGLLASFFHLSGFCLATLLLYQYRKLRPERGLSWMMVSIVTADLLIAGYSVNFTAPRKLFDTPPSSVATIAKELKDDRLYRVPVQRAALRTPSNDLMWGYRWEIEALNKAHAAFYDIPIIFNDDLDGLGQETSLRFKSVVESLPWSQKIPLLTASGVGLVLTEEEIPPTLLPRIHVIDTASSFKSYLYRNSSSRPFFFVTQWQNVNSPEMALRQMTNSGFNPEKIAELENV